MQKKRLEDLLSKFKEQRVLVVGDYYLDGYWEVDQTRSQLSFETPWHVNPVVAQRYYPGAAGTVVNNLCALGAGPVHCVGVIGTDAFADMLISKLREEGAAADGLIKSDSSITPIYLKVMYHGIGEIVMEGPRFDFENLKPMSEENIALVIRQIEKILPKVDAVIIADQVPTANFGVITDEVRKYLLTAASKMKEVVFYADSRTRIGKFKGIVIKPNRFEAKKAVEPDWSGREVDEDEAKRCGIKLAEKRGNPVFVTIGEKGIIVVEDKKVTIVPGIKVHQKTDIVGAGDSVTAGIVLSLSSRASAVEAATIGNIVGSITITKLGVTGTATPEEIISRFEEIKK